MPENICTVNDDFSTAEETSFSSRWQLREGEKVGWFRRARYALDCLSFIIINITIGKYIWDEFYRVGWLTIACNVDVIKEKKEEKEKPRESTSIDEELTTSMEKKHPFNSLFIFLFW